MYEKINKFSVTRDNAWPAPYSLCLSESRARINHLLSLLRLPPPLSRAAGRATVMWGWQRPQTLQHSHQTSKDKLVLHS